MNLELLDSELDRLRMLRTSLLEDEEILEEREKEFKRANIKLINSIRVKKDEIGFSEQRVKNIARDIYARIEFYLHLKPHEPITEPVVEEVLPPIEPEERSEIIATVEQSHGHDKSFLQRLRFRR